MKLSTVILTAIFIVGAGVVGSCSSPSSKAKHIDVKEIAFEEAPKDFRLASGFKDVQFVQLQITDDCVMGDVKKVLTARGEFVVLTKDNEVFCF